MRALVLVLLAATWGCQTATTDGEKSTTGTSDGGGNGGGGADGGSGGDGTGDGGSLPPESECTDGVDNDEDGDIDCDDADCAGVAPCWWPTSIQHDGSFAFDGLRVVCETFWGDFDEDVADCATQYSSTLLPVDDPSLQCPTCDRTFFGALSYSVNSCESVLEGGSYPSEAYFGFVFVSESQWTLYGKNDSGAWESTGVNLNVNGDQYVFTVTEPISVDTGNCDNDPLHVGDLTVTWTFQSN